jgi:three-Cys-motif partner protein
MSSNREFFARKKPWSIIKDQLLTAYLRPYLAKIYRRDNRILIADCFAGRGRFDDGNPGSPLLIAETVRNQVGEGDMAGIRLVCIEKRYFSDLVSATAGLDFVTCLDGDYEERMTFFLNQYPARGQNLFLYVDPYGIKSLRFEHFEEVIRRGFGTVELMLNLNTFGFLREACRVLKDRELREEDLSDDSPAYEQDVEDAATLDAIAGGDYWRPLVEAYYDGRMTFRQAEQQFGEGYSERLRSVFRHVLVMPIKTRLSNIPKYRIVYGTDHPHGMILMADNMCKRWRQFREDQRGGQGVLFELDHAKEAAEPSPEALRDVILDCVSVRRELSEVLVYLIERFGVNYSLSEYCMTLRKMSEGPIRIEYDPEKNPATGRRFTGLDYKSKKYRAYISRSDKWQPDLL